MKINWKIRVRNKNFWIGVIPAVILLVQAVAETFGITLDLGDVGNKLLSVVESAFVVLALLGIATDPTTPGLSDSSRALGYMKLGGDSSDDDSK